MSTQASSRAPVRVAVVGAGGYSGAELLWMLLGHPGALVSGLFASDKRASGPDAGAAPARIDSVFPRFAGVCDLPLRATSLGEIMECAPEAVFLCTPHAVSHDLAPSLVERGVVVLDLSAAFRLKDAAQYPMHYGFVHARPDLLARAVYGMPELDRAALSQAALIAVPGCYPTSAILPLAPLVREGAIASDCRPIIDSTSGVSGAGRGLNQRALFCEVSQQPYDVFAHRHQPEIDAYVGVPTIFTPHLGPYERGIVSTIHAELSAGWDEACVRDALARAYAREAFVRLLPRGTWPSAAGVRATNFCDIALAVDQRGHLILVGAIDNLVKGAAGQALQCFNARFGFDEATGLGAHRAGASARAGASNEAHGTGAAGSVPAGSRS